jgi:uncharacterized membrane protein YdcZ (DUF606 family)
LKHEVPNYICEKNQLLPRELTGQILMALVVSHFGLLESPRDPINMKKMIGAVLVLAGAIFSTY